MPIIGRKGADPQRAAEFESGPARMPSREIEPESNPNRGSDRGPAFERARQDVRGDRRPFKEPSESPFDGPGLTDILFKRPAQESDPQAEARLAKADQAADEKTKATRQRDEQAIQQDQTPRPAHLVEAAEVMVVGGVPVDATVLITQTTVTVSQDPFEGVTISMTTFFATATDLTAEELAQLQTLIANKEEPEKLIGNKTEGGQENAANFLSMVERLETEAAQKAEKNPEDERAVKQLEALRETVTNVREALKPLRVIGGALDRYLEGTQERLSAEINRRSAATPAAEPAAQDKNRRQAAVRRDDTYAIFESARALEAELNNANHHLRIRDVLRPIDKTEKELESVARAVNAARDIKAAADHEKAKNLASYAASMRTSNDPGLLRTAVDLGQEVLARISTLDISTAEKAALIANVLDTIGDIKDSLVAIMSAKAEELKRAANAEAAASEAKGAGMLVRRSAVAMVEAA